MTENETHHFDLLVPLFGLLDLNEPESEELLIDLQQALSHGFHWEVLLEDFLNLNLFY